MPAKKPDENKAEEKFEDTLERLQKLVHELESGDCSLEDSIKKFESGMVLARACQERLTQAEQKIEILLSADKDGVRTGPFTAGE
jgi:exodeoxyribonuclease VII small subunit